MRLVDAARPTFARHETFHPRYGWFRKAYTFVAADPHVFSREDAPIRAGVGKNMVRAIRFWGLAAKLIEVDQGSSNRRTPGLVPTPRGHALFGDSGWDRFMEDPGDTVAPALAAAGTSLAFAGVGGSRSTRFTAVEFADDELDGSVTTQLEAIADWKAPHPSSVRKDVSALLRTYAPAERSRRGGIEDALDCPSPRAEPDQPFGCDESVPVYVGSETHPAARGPGLCSPGLHRPHRCQGEYGHVRPPCS